MTRIGTWFFAGAALLLACVAMVMSLRGRASRPPTTIRRDTIVATLERTACYGTCPVYKLVIHADGRVDYHGERFVMQRGDATGQLAPVELAALRTTFEHADYFALADRYEHESFTDEPTAITSFTEGTRTKTIRHYEGDDTAPDALGQLEAGVDLLAHVDRWIGTPQQREAHRGAWR